MNILVQQKDTLSSTMSFINTISIDNTASFIEYPKTSIYTKFESDFKNRKEPLIKPSTSTINTNYCITLIKMNATAVDGDFIHTWQLYEENFLIPITTPGYKKPPIKVFKILLIAFKNSSQQDFSDAFLIFYEMDIQGYKPDIFMFNILLQACVRGSRWRRCLALIKEMKEEFHLQPNSQSYMILMDCCRHAIDTPADIFQILRHAKLPMK